MAYHCFAFAVSSFLRRENRTIKYNYSRERGTQYIMSYTCVTESNNSLIDVPYVVAQPETSLYCSRIDSNLCMPLDSKVNRFDLTGLLVECACMSRTHGLITLLSLDVLFYSITPYKCEICLAHTVKSCIKAAA